MPDEKKTGGDSVCFRCGSPLGKDDAGAYRRFVDRDAERFLCMRCLCSDLGCSESYLRGRIEFLRENGCLLFPKEESQ